MVYGSEAVDNSVCHTTIVDKLLRMARSIGPLIREHWQRLSATAAGRWLFSCVLGWYVPYTGSLGAIISVLEPGRCVIRLNDRRKIRNHLRSIHAIAVCNLGEMATGLALNNSLPAHARAILTDISVAYLKKARGDLIAECLCVVPADNQKRDYLLDCSILNLSGDVVATVKARWRVGPDQDKRDVDID